MRTSSPPPPPKRESEDTHTHAKEKRERKEKKFFPDEHVREMRSGDEGGWFPYTSTHAHRTHREINNRTAWINHRTRHLACLLPIFGSSFLGSFLSRCF